MNPNEFGKRLGIGLRVAGRIAQQRAQAQAQNQSVNAHSANASSPPNPPQGVVEPPHSSTRIPSPPRTTPNIREISEKTHKFTRAAGRGIGGFLRPFTRVGGILWLEVTGFFFGLFAIYFAQDLWRTRFSYAAGPQHTRFLIAVALTAVFSYLSVSAFWRAKRK